MKHILLGGLLLFLCSCSSKQDHSTAQTQTRAKQPTGLQGKWYYTAYTDSTILDRTIYKYAGACASYAYELNFLATQPDSCAFTGYHESTRMPIRATGPGTYRVGTDPDTAIFGQYWEIKLTRRNQQECLELKERWNSAADEKKRADPHTYLFFRRKTDFPTSDLALQRYFAQHLLAGTYRDTATQQEVQLLPNLRIRGLGAADTFALRIDFWQMGPQRDMLDLVDTDRDSVQSLHWFFEKNFLILQSVTNEYDEGGDYADSVPDSTLHVLERIGA